jgi:hypothetical protein
MQLKLLDPQTETDTAIHATVNRVQSHFFGRMYPLADRPPIEPELPTPLAGLPAHIESLLPYHEAARLATTRQAQYDAYEGALGTIEKLYAENAQFLQDVFTCNVEVRGAWTNDRRKFELMQAVVEEWNHKLPKFLFERPRLLTLDLHKKPDFVVRSALLDGIRGTIHTLVKKFVQGLDCLVEMEQVGLIEWIQDDGCRFHFYKNVIEETNGDVRETTREDVTDRGSVRERKKTTRTERDYVRSRRHARHVHDVVCAQNLLLNSSRDLKMPPRVRKLLDSSPDYVKPFMRVVTGTEVRRLMIERDLATETLTESEESVTVAEEIMYRPDPAVVIGHYVLTGWGAEELEPLPASPTIEPVPIPAISAPPTKQLPPPKK